MKDDQVIIMTRDEIKATGKFLVVYEGLDYAMLPLALYERWYASHERLRKRVEELELENAYLK